MQDKVETVEGVIEALGGPTAVASLACIGVSAVSNWNKRGRISRDSFIVIRDALAAIGKEAAPQVFGFKETLAEGSRP